MEPHQEINDTICAISTPPGVGGIAVARVSGPGAIRLVGEIWQGKELALCPSHTVHLGTLLDTRRQPLDQGVATIYRSPRSFTGEDVVELSVHGSRWIQRELIASLVKAGCRLAEPGEFTRRAFASGKIDLAKAEAVADMIASGSRAAHRAAITQMRGTYSQRISTLRDRLIELASLLELELDFSEEEVEFASRAALLDLAGSLYREITRLHASFAAGRVIKEGIPVAIVGPTNAGKSSLLNALAGDERAIVSDIHGTTRDIVDDLIEIGDYQFRFQDTAGLRDTADTIERIGIDRSRRAAQSAAIILYILDISQGVTPADISELRRLAGLDGRLLGILNKTDLGSPAPCRDAITAALGAAIDPTDILEISTLRPDTLHPLADRLTSIMAGDTPADDIIVTNARHARALDQAARSISRVTDGLRAGLPGDLIAQDLRETLHHLATITGAITTPDLLTTIFTRFCIGK